MKAETKLDNALVVIVEYLGLEGLALQSRFSYVYIQHDIVIYNTIKDCFQRFSLSESHVNRMNQIELGNFLLDAIEQCEVVIELKKEQKSIIVKREIKEWLTE